MSDYSTLEEQLKACEARVSELEGEKPPEVKDTPQIMGDGTIGATLTVTMGNWTGQPTSYTGAWMGDGATALGEGETYEVQASDAGTDITCVVTATNAAGSTTAPPSNAVSVAGTRSAAHSRGTRENHDERHHERERGKR